MCNNVSRLFAVQHWLIGVELIYHRFLSIHSHIQVLALKGNFHFFFACPAINSSEKTTPKRRKPKLETKSIIQPNTLQGVWSWALPRGPLTWQGVNVSFAEECPVGASNWFEIEINFRSTSAAVFSTEAWFIHSHSKDKTWADGGGGWVLQQDTCLDWICGSWFITQAGRAHAEVLISGCILHILCWGAPSSLVRRCNRLVGWLICPSYKTNQLVVYGTWDQKLCIKFV